MNLELGGTFIIDLACVSSHL